MKKIFLPTILLVTCTALSAAERKVDLQECIKIALENHPGILVSLEDRKQSLARYRLAQSATNLNIYGEIKTIEYPRKEVTNASFSVPGVGSDIGLYLGVNAAYRIFDLKARKIIQASKIDMDLEKFKAQKSSNDIVLNVKRAYVGYLSARKKTAIWEQLLQKYNEKLALVQKLFNSGLRPILDVNNVAVQQAETSLEYEKALNAERSAKNTLFMAMGIREEDIAIIPEEIENLPELRFSLLELNKLAEIYYPNMAIIKLQKRIGKLKVDAEKAERYPTFDLVFGLGVRNTGIQGFDNFEQNFERRSWEIAATGYFRIYIPIYSGGGTEARIEVARTAYNKVAYQEQDVLFDMQNKIRDEFMSLDELYKQRDMAKMVITQAERHLLLARKSYENGIGSLIELQDAETRLIRAEIGYHEAKYRYLLSLAKLANIVGLGEDFICKKPQ